ncbi:MAG TPA: thiamine-phosphate kinase [Abditibacteriaceae bacterium]|jgi:thiamine-monophosphate kinase
MKLDELGEFGWIDRVRKQLAVRGGVRVGIGDDAAVLAPLSSPVITCDALVEDVHFRRDWTTPRALGRKSMAVNVSDIAAMGGIPVAAFVTLAISARDDAVFLDELYAGFEDAAREFEFTVAGGDTVRSRGGLQISVSIVGNAPRPVLRSGARVGDAVVVTGNLGESAAGLWILQNPEIVRAISHQSTAYLLSRHCEPSARVGAMQAALATEDVHAALDISDGLVGDAGHIARKSGVTLEFEVGRLPVSPELREAALVAAPHDAEIQLRHWMLAGGEDYELLLCVAPEAAESVCAAIRQSGTAAMIAGRCVTAGKDAVVVRDARARNIEVPRAWTHF